MDRLRTPVLVALIGVAFAGIPGCGEPGVTSADRVAAQDAAFTDMQARGQQAMGVGQYTSTHLFDALADGGRIELQRNVDDAAGVAQIRQHLQEIARVFDAGDFSTAALSHMRSVAGTSVMAAKRDAITYTYRDLPRGGEVRIVTQDPQALQAIHDFISFQRRDHRAGVMEHGYHSGMDNGKHDHGGMDQRPHDHAGMDHE